MEKVEILKLIKMVYDRINNNECTQDELNTVSKYLTESVDPLLTRTQIPEVFGVSQQTADNAVSQRFNPKKKVRNTVMMYYSDLKKVFKK